MQFRRAHSLTCGLAAALLAAAVAPAAHVAAASGLAPDWWDTFTADLTLRQSYVAPDGTPLRAAPPATLVRVQRSLLPTGWHTVMTLQGLEDARAVGPNGPMTLGNPFAAMRFEYDGSGTAPRLYDERGVLIQPGSDADRQLLGLATALQRTWTLPASVQASARIAPASRAWLDTIVATPDKRGDRQQALDERFGPPLAISADGTEWFETTIGGDWYLVGADVPSALPIRTIHIRGPIVISDTTWSYTPYAGGVLVRSLMHTVQPMPDGVGLNVLDLQISNVSLTSGGL